MNPSNRPKDKVRPHYNTQYFNLPPVYSDDEIEDAVNYLQEEVRVRNDLMHQRIPVTILKSDYVAMGHAMDEACQTIKDTNSNAELVAKYVDIRLRTITLEVKKLRSLLLLQTAVYGVCCYYQNVSLHRCKPITPATKWQIVSTAMKHMKHPDAGVTFMAVQLLHNMILLESNANSDGIDIKRMKVLAHTELFKRPFEEVEKFLKLWELFSKRNFSIARYTSARIALSNKI